MRIAILEHDHSQYAQLSGWLNRSGAELHRFSTPDAIVHSARKGDIDLLVVHWQPYIAPQRLRELMDLRSPPIPLLLVAERSSIHSLTLLLDQPACDYLLKPLRRIDVETRIDVLEKRFYAPPIAEEQPAFGPYVFDTRAEQLRLNGQTLRLTQKEFRLALLFFRHLDRPLSRAFILESVWPDQAELSSRSIDTHVSRVRSKLNLQPARGFRLVPVYSYGYRLEQING